MRIGTVGTGFITNYILDNIEKTERFIKEKLDLSVPVHLLPYHNFGTAKEERLEWERQNIFSKPEEEQMAQIKTWMENYGIAAQIGGSM